MKGANGGPSASRQRESEEHDDEEDDDGQDGGADDEVLDLPDADLAPELTDQTLKKMVLRFERRSLKNRELRIKFPDQPVKYDSGRRSKFH